MNRELGAPEGRRLLRRALTPHARHGGPLGEAGLRRDGRASGYAALAGTTVHAGGTHLELRVGPRSEGEAVVEFSPLAFAVVQPALPVQLGHLPHRRVAEVEGVRKASAGGRSGGRIHWSVARHSQHVAFHSHNAPGVKGERVGNGNRTPSNVRLFEHRADCVFVRAYACVVYVPAPARVYHAARLPPPAERPCADRAAHHSQQPEVRALHLLVPWPA